MGVLVDITTRCNMTCGHCMWSRTQQGQDMTEEIFRAALAMKPVRGFGTFSLGSGEPTVHPQFFDFLAIAIADTRWRVRVVTNGKLSAIALKVAELAGIGQIEGHLSLDRWHDPIDPAVIAAFKRDASNPSDKRAYRFCDQEDLKNVGRCDFALDKRPSCRCPVPKITVDGSVFFCGCERAISIGHVLTGWDERLAKEPRKLNCDRYALNADSDAPSKLFDGLRKISRLGVSKSRSDRRTRREMMGEIIDRVRPVFEKHGEFKVMGSFARGDENPRDVDVLFVSSSAELDLNSLISSAGGKRVRTFKTRVQFEIDGLKFELFPTRPETKGAAELYLEGPLERNMNLRREAKSRGLVWKFEGLFSSDGKAMPCVDRDSVLSMIVKEHSNEIHTHSTSQIDP